MNRKEMHVRKKNGIQGKVKLLVFSETAIFALPGLKRNPPTPKSPAA